MKTITNQLESFKKKFEDIVLSFQKIPDDQLEDLVPPKIKITSASSNLDFFENILNETKLQTMFSKEIISTLNNIQNDKVNINKKIKTVY